MPKPPHILEGESIEDFDALSKSLVSQFEPVTETERSVIDMMIHHEWMMRRAVRMRETLLAASRDEEADPKRLNVVERYYKHHERSFASAKRELESMRKHKKKIEALAAKQAASSRNQQRQWEQLLKKMPTLTDWVN